MQQLWSSVGKGIYIELIGYMTSPGGEGRLLLPGLFAFSWNRFDFAVKCAQSRAISLILSTIRCIIQGITNRTIRYDGE